MRGACVVAATFGQPRNMTVAVYDIGGMGMGTHSPYLRETPPHTARQSTQMNSGVQEDVALGHIGVALRLYDIGPLVIIDSGDAVTVPCPSRPSTQVECSVAEVGVGVHVGITNVGIAEIPVAHSIHSLMYSQFLGRYVCPGKGARRTRRRSRRRS